MCLFYLGRKKRSKTGTGEEESEGEGTGSEEGGWGEGGDGEGEGGWEGGRPRKRGRPPASTRERIKGFTDIEVNINNLIV